jgi:hypothetical protein
MPPVTNRQRIGLGVAVLGAAAAGSVPALAIGDDGQQAVSVARPSTTTVPTTTTTTPPPPRPHRKAAKLSVHVRGVKHKRVEVGGRIRATAYLRPYVSNQHVRLRLMRNHHVVKKANPIAKRVRHRDLATVHFHSPQLLKPGKYRVVARHQRSNRQKKGIAHSGKFGIHYPDLDPGQHNHEVKLFNHLLLKRGYYTSHGHSYGTATGLAVLAFRKVNGMKRITNANPGIFKMLAAGDGSFKLKYPDAGRHVEVDISRQVMVLAAHGKPQYTFHVSTGAPATPTIRGHYQFYSRQPGYNSEGMYYSVYFHGGYATHGYNPVPTYPASHGCVRNPIPFSVFIYNWVQLGMSIYLYD